MERLHFTMQIKSGREAEYDLRHREVWPALQADLYAAGWRNYSLFRTGLTVHAYVECHPDVATAMGAMGASAANEKWQSWFADVLDQVVDEHGALISADEVWHLDEELARHTSRPGNDAATKP